MKSTKIGLGLGTLVVAIFMAFAFTAAPTTTMSWYVPDNPAEGPCLPNRVVECDLGDTFDCDDPAIPATNQAAYADDQCNNPLSKEQGF